MTVRQSQDLLAMLQSLDGRGYKGYRDLRGEFQLAEGLVLVIDRIQADPFAPPSFVRFRRRSPVLAALCHEPDRQRGVFDARPAVGAGWAGGADEPVAAWLIRFQARVGSRLTPEESFAQLTPFPRGDLALARVQEALALLARHGAGLLLVEGSNEAPN